MACSIDSVNSVNSYLDTKNCSSVIFGFVEFLIQGSSIVVLEFLCSKDLCMSWLKWKTAKLVNSRTPVIIFSICTGTYFCLFITGHGR